MHHIMFGNILLLQTMLCHRAGAIRRTSAGSGRQGWPRRAEAPSRASRLGASAPRRLGPDPDLVPRGAALLDRGGAGAKKNGGEGGHRQDHVVGLDFAAALGGAARRELPHHHSPADLPQVHAHPALPPPRARKHTHTHAPGGHEKTPRDVSGPCRSGTANRRHHAGYVRRPNRRRWFPLACAVPGGSLVISCANLGGHWRLIRARSRCVRHGAPGPRCPLQPLAVGCCVLAPQPPLMGGR